ncbi:hypothetical protein [Streptomyces spirodelae]|uniref:Uncharacterized protein n=1 Tax=Streptomyces spirodelae TaxID=2812904 RepID=A0ABS3WUP8_9ACTN|nr:hypothetical protein [Streptomyces spirodelae]MBO8186824.1 hypothetical protein [Streptomyces spirodelae]
MVDFLIGTAEDHTSAHGGDFREVSLALLKELLDDGLMEIGELGESGFEAWEEPIDQILDKFKRACEACNWKPMGGLWWLANTTKGSQWLRART